VHTNIRRSVQADILVEAIGDPRTGLEAMRLVEQVSEVERMVPDVRGDIKHDATGLIRSLRNPTKRS